MLSELHLRDLLLIEGSFPLCANSNNRFASSLLSFLNILESDLSNLSQSLLPKPISDNGHTLLDGGGIKGRKTPFILRNCG